MQNPIVSVICNAYNHELYIRDALEGFVTQKTNFPFEVLVHDDASTDNTASIIREYEEKYPDLIKPIYQTENQYSKGGVSQFQYPRAKGRYIAFCEGDDFWTDPLKLQKQFDAMEAHPEVDICAHAALAVASADKSPLYAIEPMKENGILTAEQVIAGGGGYVATNSLFYRRELIEDLPAFRRFLKLDYSLQIHGSLRGGMLYLSDCMSTYRVQSIGSWTSRQLSSPQRQIDSMERIVTMLTLLDEDTHQKYAETIRVAILNKRFAICLAKNDVKAVFSPAFEEVRRALPVGQRLKLRVKAAFPFLTSIKRRLSHPKQSNKP